MKIPAKDAALAIPLNSVEKVFRRLTDEHELDIFLVRGSTGFVIALEIHKLPQNIRLPELEDGDVLAVEFMKQDGVLRIGLSTANYVDVFYVLVDDLVESIITNQGLEAGSRAVMTRLHRWKRLLEASSQGLSKSAQKGLFGELNVLRSVIGAVGNSNGVEAWLGPEGGTRDFELNSTGIEVKTTAGKGLLHVRLSSERQLEIVAVERLFLWCVSIEKSEIGKTLNEMIDSIRTSIGSDYEILESFDSKLMRSGYSPNDHGRYTTKYIIRDEHIYQILEGFPRITTADIPNCVFDVNYSIDIEACETWRQAPAAIWEINP